MLVLTSSVHLSYLFVSIYVRQYFFLSGWFFMNRNFLVFFLRSIGVIFGKITFSVLISICCIYSVVVRNQTSLILRMFPSLCAKL
mgnify:CR=1 FL=1